MFAHIASITNIQQMTQPSAEKLRAMIDTVDQHMRMLERFGIKRDAWSAIICVLMLGKLDTETRNLWESKDSMPSMPDASALFAFLEQRILAIRNIELSGKRVQPPTNGSDNANGKQKGNDDNKHRREDRKRPNTAISHASKPNTQPPSCPQCGNDEKHFLWKCNAFSGLTSPQQLEQLKKWGICEVCLIARHAANECTKGICPICKTDRHNTLVCPQRSKKKVHHVRHNKRSRRSAKGE